MSNTSVVARLWQEHLAAPFPARLRGAELAGDVDMVLLDTYTAGCISTWLSNGGYLDEDRNRILSVLLNDFSRVISLITDAQDREYFQRLHTLARLTYTPDPEP